MSLLISLYFPRFHICHLYFPKIGYFIYQIIISSVWMSPLLHVGCRLTWVRYSETFSFYNLSKVITTHIKAATRHGIETFNICFLSNNLTAQTAKMLCIPQVIMLKSQCNNQRSKRYFSANDTSTSLEKHFIKRPQRLDFKILYKYHFNRSIRAKYGNYLTWFIELKHIQTKTKPRVYFMG